MKQRLKTARSAKLRTPMIMDVAKAIVVFSFDFSIRFSLFAARFSMVPLSIDAGYTVMQAIPRPRIVFFLSYPY